LGWVAANSSRNIKYFYGNKLRQSDSQDTKADFMGFCRKVFKKVKNTIHLRGHPHSFGRGDQLDVAGLKRLKGSLSRFMSPEDAQAIEAEDQGLKFESSYPASGAVLRKN
jgi:hypothetical protein